VAKQAASAVQPTAEDNDQTAAIAEKLFVANWVASSGYTAESVAAKCFDAAEAFERVRRERMSTTAIPFAGAKAS
jgi:hypothetical protein